MKSLAATFAVSLLLTGPADAFTCAQVRWAVKNLPAETMAQYIAGATKEQIAFGRACLRVRHKVARRRHRR